MMRAVMCLALVAGLSVVVGCAGGKPTVELSGDVVFNGKPIEKGTISFESVQQRQPPLSVEIASGKYKAAVDRGLVPGVYLVRITAPDLAKPKPTGFQNEVTYPPLLPPVWHSQSQVKVDLKQGRQTIVFRGENGAPPKVETAG
jgi:hypothetical protein